MVKIDRYHPEDKEEWDHFISRSRNATFLFFRNYMDYHEARFEDHSLMFYEGKDLIGVLPGTIENENYISHGGLTYGGVLVDSKMTTIRMLKVFDVLLPYLKGNGAKRLIYKAIPHIYHQVPTEEDLYVLFIKKARLVKREVSSTIFIQNASFPSHRRRGALKASKEGVFIQESNEFKPFIDIVNHRLREKYSLNAVHTFEEIGLLASRFPEQIRFFGAYNRNDLLAGTIVYINRNTVHLQYLSATERGRKLRALDLVIQNLLFETFNKMTWFDFGISTENGGLMLNEGLISQKEEYGASALNYDTYLLDLV